MKRTTSIMLVLIMVMAMLSVKTTATEPTISVGTKTSEIDTNKLEQSGYMVLDNNNGNFRYTWPYTLGWLAESSKAYGGNALHNAGQVSSEISYDFTGNYIAIAFCETYYAAKIKVYIDNEMAGEYTPHIKDKTMSEKAGESKIIFVKDNLSDGEHTLVIKHEAARTSGEENKKADGNAYYDNDAYFDCVIVKKEEIKEPTKIEQGANIKGYTDAVLDKLGLKAIYSDNEEITYTWPYDLDAAKVNSNNRKYRFNLGQVGAEITCDFEGSYLAIVFAECYYAAKVIIDVDGEVIGEITPHTDKVKVSDTPYTSKIQFIKDNLKGGSHTLTIQLEAAHTTGEENIKGDGKAYYDNDAFFDCFIVQKNPDQKETTPTPEVKATPTTEVTETIDKTINPGTDDTNNTTGLVIGILIAVTIAIGIVVIIKRKRC